MKAYIKLFSDTLSIVDDLSNEEAGMLFKAINVYHKDNTEILSGVMKAVFNQFKKDIDKARESYDNVVERNKSNGIKGGRPKTQNNPVGFSNNPIEPKKSQEQEQEQNKKNINTGVFTPDQFSRLKTYRSMIKKAFKTQQAITLISNKFKECYEAGYDFEEVFTVMAERQWQSIELEWITKALPKKKVSGDSFGDWK